MSTHDQIQDPAPDWVVDQFTAMSTCQLLMYCEDLIMSRRLPMNPKATVSEGVQTMVNRVLDGTQTEGSQFVGTMLTG